MKKLKKKNEDINDLNNNLSYYSYVYLAAKPFEKNIPWYKQTCQMLKYGGLVLSTYSLVTSDRHQKKQEAANNLLLNIGGGITPALNILLILFDETSKPYIEKWNNEMHKIEQKFTTPEGIGDIINFGF